jgi:hypothetical protein
MALFPGRPGGEIMRRKKKGLSGEARKEDSVLRPGFWSGIPAHWQAASLAFLATRLPLALFAWLVHRFLGSASPAGQFLYHGGGPHANWLVDAFQKWDSYWFLNIVRNGYHFYGVQEQMQGVAAGIPETNVTPFPLYPMLMKGVGWLTGDPAVAGLVVSQVCLFLALVLIYRLARLETDDNRANWAVWLFAVQPWTYAFSAIYSESLFFVLVVAAVLAARRNRFLLAGLAGMLASMTRLLGVLVLVPVGLEYLSARQYKIRRIDWRALSLALIPLGTLIYFGYLWRITGNALIYFVAQSGWHKEVVGPWYHPLRWLTAGGFNGESLFDLGTTVVMCALLFLGYRRIRRSYWIYALAYFLILMSSSDLLGLARYCAGLFPVYLILAGLAERSPRAGRVILVLFAMSAPVVFFIWTAWLASF